MVTWDIQRDGRAWGDEAMNRCLNPRSATVWPASSARRLLTLWP